MTLALEDESVYAALDSVLIVWQSVEVEANESLLIPIAKSGEEILDQALLVTGVRAGRRRPAWESQFRGRVERRFTL